MNNLSVSPVQAYYYQPQVMMIPVQAAPLPDLFHAMPADSTQIRPRGPVAPMPVQLYAPAQFQGAYNLPQNLIKNTEPETYRGKFAKSLEKVGQSMGEQLTGAGTMVVGAAQTTVYAPLGALEAVGRTAVALTGGNVSYDRPSPLHQMGDGLDTVGQGAGQVLVATGKQALAATEAMVYAPMAGMEVIARGAGMVAGSAAWAGKQVSDSFLGKEFRAGYQGVMPSNN